MEPPILRWLPLLFGLIFVAIWLVCTSLVGFLSGWFRLQGWYADDGTDDVLVSTAALPGYMGRWGVRVSGWLTLAACRKGLSLRMFRLLAPFQRPLLIPWSEIEASSPIEGWFGGQRVDLRFGQPPVGQLAITAQTWAKLVEARAGADGPTS